MSFKTKFLLLMVFSISFDAVSQDNHYWAQQYGAVGSLMGGAMVGGVDDNSAVYYNPGALSFITNTSLSVDANVYRMDKIYIKDGAGNDVNLNSAQLSVYPQIIAGMLNIFKESRFRFSYTMLTRNHGNVLMNARYTSTSAQSDPPSTTSFVGGFDYINQLNEQWFGIGTAYKISDNLGAGVTLFATYRGQSYSRSNYVQEVENMGAYNVFRTQTIDEAVKYSNYQLISKIGLSYRTGPFKLGFTVSTPSVRIFGSGNVQRENSTITISENDSDMEKNFLIMDRKTNVKAIYHHPLSIAAGAEYMSEKTRIAFTAEYFLESSPYHLLEPQSVPFVYPQSYLDSAEYKPLIESYTHVELATRSVMNAGIGFSHEIFNKLTLLLGAYTDFCSYRNPHDANELSGSLGEFDIYHFSSGLSYTLNKQSVTAGISYAYSPSVKVPPYTIINQDPSADEATLSSHTFSVILGYTYFFSRSGD